MRTCTETTSCTSSRRTIRSWPTWCAAEPFGRDQVAEHRLRHTITNVVGGPELGVKVEARALEVQAGDRLLLCSDGLTEMVTNEAIAATLDAEPAPEAAAKKLLALANEGDASDNITLIVVRFDPAAPRQGRLAMRGEQASARHFEERVRVTRSSSSSRRISR